MGSAGATATVFSACSSPFDRSVSAAGLTGGEFGKSVPLATAGPGGNPNWQPGDAVKFLPPMEIPTRGQASDVLAALPKEKLLKMYELMSASRKWETAMKDLFLGAKDGLYGAFHTYVGEEAIAVGAISALNEDDYIASTHRGHGHLIAKGGDLNRMSAEIFFKESGYNKGYGGSMHITDMSKGIMGMNGIVGASYYMAAGAALRGMVRGTNQVAVAFFGDGAAASPYYFSAVRSSANLKVPVIFVNENNFQYMGVPMAIDGADQVHRRVHQGAGHPASCRRWERRLGRVRRDARSGRVGARRQGPEHDRRHDLPLVRSRRVRRRQGGAGRRDGAAVSLGRRGPAVDVSRSDYALQDLAAGQGPRHGRRARRARDESAGGC